MNCFLLPTRDSEYFHIFDGRPNEENSPAFMFNVAFYLLAKNPFWNDFPQFFKGEKFAKFSCASFDWKNVRSKMENHLEMPDTQS